MFGNTSFGNNSFGTSFGATPSLGPFGSTAQQPTQAAGPVGTTIKFVPFTTTETVPKAAGGGPSQVTVRYQHICAMKEYETKSVEELRLEDYAANRKFGQPQSTFGSTSFNQSGFSSSPFGAQQQTGQQNTSIFGSNAQPTQSIFGSTTPSTATNIFGQPKSTFDQPASSNNLFSSTFNKPSTSTSSPFNIGTPFGSAANANTSNTSQSSFSLFSKPQNPPTSTAFGMPQQTPAQPAPLFGTPTAQPQASSLFGSPSVAPQTTSLFGTSPQTSTTSLFANNNTTNLFGQQKSAFEPASNTSNLFGNTSFSKPNNPTGSLFNIGSPFGSTTNTNTSTANQTNAAKFGQPQSTFSATPFNQPNLGTSPFGAQQPATQQNTSIFGNAAQPTPSIFGTANPSTSTNIFGQPKSSFDPPASTNNLFGSTFSKPSTSTNSPFNIGTPFGSTANANTSATSQSSFSLFSKPQNPPTSTAFGMPQQTPTQPAPLFGTPSVQPQASSLFGSPSVAPQNTSLFGSSPQASTTSLFANINSSNIFGSPKSAFEPTTNTSPFGDTSFNKPNNSTSSLFNIGSPFNMTQSANTSPTNQFNLLKTNSSVPQSVQKLINQFKMNAKTNLKLNKPATDPRPRPYSALFDEPTPDDLRCAIDVFVPKKSIKKLELKPANLNDSINGSPERTSSSIDKSCFVISTRPDYTLKPSPEEIDMCYNPEEDTCIVNSLLIERANYGSIFFSTPLDVKGINIDDVVYIGKKEVIVYPDDENKPPVGQGLNRPATITLYHVWPVDKSNNELIKDVDRLKLMKYPEKIESATQDMGAKFIEYQPSTGTWVFAVKHFSKYGIKDEEETSTLNNTTTVIPPTPSPQFKMSSKPHLKLLFEEEREEPKMALDRSPTLPGTKRIALQNVSPIINKQVVAAPIPKKEKIRKIYVEPDTYPVQNKLIRDIASVCIAGAPKVRFFNGSRNYCYVKGDSVILNELKLVPTTSNSVLAEDLEDKFETYLTDNSMVIELNDNDATSYDFLFAPYIESKDYIRNANSFELLRALYGDDLNSKTPYARQDERLTRVINWLSAVNRKLTPPKELYQLIIYYMCCDRYDLASSAAIENDHPRLGLLVSTLNLNKDVIHEQLCSWRLSTADQYIDEELLKIYVLLSGYTEWKLSNDTTIYCLKGLKWTQQLCLLATHVTSFYTEPDKYGFHLLPMYIKRLDTDTNDVDYHILARHNPALILSAAETVVEEWFLLESLKSFHVINTETECSNSDIIHCNLASQLIPIDLRWACFVALHITNNNVRKQVLLTCLEQNLDQLKRAESWLHDWLKIPKQFFSKARSMA